MPASQPSHLIRSLEEIALRQGLEPGPFGRRLEELSTGAPDPERALRNLQRYLETGFAASRIKDFLSYPVILEVVFELMGQSQYLADILVRDPELLRWLTASNELKRTRTAADLFVEAVDAMSLFEKTERKLDSIRRFHRREMLRIGAREILREGNIQTITAELSALADASTQAIVLVSHNDLNARLEADVPNDLAVIALGKLGGDELNFSSDIDLLFVYERDGDLPRPAGRLHSYHEYYVRLAEQIVKGLSEFTGEGHLYRVDMRLRPDGRSGPLAMSRAAMMTYYESRGAAWERQMMLKARPIAGSLDVGGRFLNDIRPFLFPRSALRSPWDEIAGMKRSIEQEGVTEGNIKLGAGGIRDIEFLVQGLQLLYAGNEPRLRTGHTLQTIERLTEAGLLPGPIATELKHAYEFLRTVEHRLQLLHGHQTHQLPESRDEFRVLGRKLGFPSATSLQTHLDGLRSFVRSQFEAFASGPPSGTSVSTFEPMDALIAHAVDDRPWPEQVRSVAQKRLKTVFSSPSSHRLLEIVLRQGSHREWLVRTAASSSRIMELLAAEPLLLETLLGNGQELLGRSVPGWTALRANDLRRYGLYNSARSAIRFLSNKASVRTVESELSELADEVIGIVSDCLLSGQQGLVLVGVGKLGGKEMGFSSDLDLISVYDGRFCDRDEAERFTRTIGTEISATLSLYKVDFRLRPEGKNAPLAVEVAYLSSYFADRAAPWERMAISRARIVWGDRRFGARLLRSLRKWSTVPVPGLSVYIRRMRMIMERERVKGEDLDVKVSAGGIADPEFLAQALALSVPDLQGLPTDQVLQKSMTRRRLDRSFGTTLRTGLDLLRSVELLVRLNSAASTSAIPTDPQVRACMAVALGLKDERQLMKTVSAAARSNRRAFRAALRQIELREKRTR